MATVVSPPCGPRTDTARHCTPEPSTDGTVVGVGPTSLSAGSAGSAFWSLTTVQVRPSGSTSRT
ncbi:hypothetical protein C1Y40_01143 [Mycobacterium talmoniae]|uniref:Uncharacterized protein n=1 Tax=Mycobacterium talmoniae TaxID=1858794 RepID=A0A2S8BPN5_9MYCO|nr:hypothetical protein C1Y40_01143 [Mycobacterium talmoniae]